MKFIENEIMNFKIDDENDKKFYCKEIENENNRNLAKNKIEKDKFIDVDLTQTNQKGFENVEIGIENDEVLFQKDVLSEEEENEDDDNYNTTEEEEPERNTLSESQQSSIRERLRSWNFGRNSESAKAAASCNPDDPKTIRDIVNLPNSKEWKDALQAEYNSLIKNRTWVLSDLPEGRSTIGCIWVLKTKFMPDGTIEKRKARLVAKGYNQKYAVDLLL